MPILVLFDVSILHPKLDLIQACHFEHTCQQVLYHDTCLHVYVKTCIPNVLLCIRGIGEHVHW